MFLYDSEYTEESHRYEADAAELAMLDTDRRDMQEYPAPALQMRFPVVDIRCCESSTNYTFHPSFGNDPETGYVEAGYYICVCGNRIAEEDLAGITAWENKEKRKQQRSEAA